MIIFDIDDTLIDHSGAELVASEKFGVQFKNEIPDYDETDFCQRWHNEAEKHIEAFLNGEIDFQEQRRRRIRGIFNNDSISDNEVDDIFENYLQHYENSWKTFTDVIPFLEKNKAWEFGILSDGAQHQQEQKLEKTRIRKYFKFILTAESAGMSKPNPDFFTKACMLAGSTPSNTFYIGDNIKKDAVGAYHAGLNGVWLNRKRQHSEIKWFCIDSLNDFVPNEALQWTQTSCATELLR